MSTFIDSFFETVMSPVFDFFGPEDGALFVLTLEDGAEIRTRGAFSIRTNRDPLNGDVNMLLSTARLDIPRSEVLSQLLPGIDLEHALHGATVPYLGRLYRIETPVDDRRAIVKCPLSVAISQLPPDPAP